MDYTRLSLSGVAADLGGAADDAGAEFGALGPRQLNWRPDATRWSVGQCFDHLVTSNRLMLESARRALSGARPSVWQRLPVLPRVYGRTMVRALEPTASRRYKSPSRSTPAASDVAPDIVAQFVAQQREAAAWARAVDADAAARTIMASPFVSLIVYSVLDGCRIVAAHDRRHMRQAARVVAAPGFPEKA